MNLAAAEELYKKQSKGGRRSDRPVYTPGEDPGEFGRRVAEFVFEKYVKNSDNEVVAPKED